MALPKTRFSLSCIDKDIRVCYTISNSASLSFSFKRHSELQSNKSYILNFTAISLFMVISALTGVTSPATVKDTPKVEATVTESSVVKRISNKEVENIMGTESYVRQYFSDIPIMIEIARCESHFRQLDRDGDIHRGVVNNADVGVMQINEFYHLDRAEKDNYNIYTIEGNTAYARDLYERQGTQPWASSKPCWSKYVNQNLAMNSTSLKNQKSD